MRACILFFIFSLNCLSYALSQKAIQTICVKDVCIQAEVVNTDAARQRGLMFRENLPEGRGMLFVFATEGQYGFWMKNMKFPIDIIWINKERKVADIKFDLQPCEEVCEPFKDGYIEKGCAIFSPKDKALYVLEVNSGFAKKNNLIVGDKVDFQTGSGEDP